MILAGDIGGTSTRLALFDVAGGRLQPIVQQKYPSREHASLRAAEVTPERQTHHVRRGARTLRHVGVVVVPSARGGICDARRSGRRSRLGGE